MATLPKVLFVMQMPPPVHGAAMMGQYIHDSALINASFECRYINESFSTSVDNVGKVSIGKFLHLFRHLRDIRRTIKEFHPDLIYLTPGGGDPGLWIFRNVLEISVLNAYKHPVILHFHNKSTKEKTGKWYLRWYYRMMFRHSNVILLSHRLEEQYARYLKQGQVFICPNGIPDPIEGDTLERNRTSVPRLLFLSNLIVSKGVLVLLDALKILKEKGYSFMCDFVGDVSCDLTDTLFRTEVELRGLTDRVLYHGAKYDIEKIRALVKADLFVFPTYYHNECFPLVLLEATACGLPVISTEEGAIPDIVQDGENGYLCRLRDSEDLADHIAMLLDDRQLCCMMGKRSRELFLAKFTLGHLEKRLCEIIGDCLATHNTN